MKVNKVGSFVLLVLALAFAILGVVFLLLPEALSPVTVSDTPIARKSGGYINLYFTLKNESDEDVVITYLSVNVSTDNGTESAETDEYFTIKANDTHKCEYGFESYKSPNAVSRISIKVDGKHFDVYSTGMIINGFKALSILFFAFAVVFGITTAVNFNRLIKQQRRYDLINKEIDEKFAGNAIFAVGYSGRKGETGKAAAKTAASVAGGAIFAGLFGFGTFKVYGSNQLKEFVLSDDGLYIGNPLKSGFDLGAMSYLEKRAFSEAETTVKKKRLVLTNKANGEFFVFDMTDNKQITVEQLSEKLNKMIADCGTQTENPPTENGEKAAADNINPFDI